MKPIKLQIGCTYYLRVKPIGTDGKAILPQTITNAVFKVAGAKTVYPHTIDGAFFCLTLPASEIEGVYDLFLEGNIGTDAYSYAWNDLWERTKYSDAIEYSTYHTCCVIVGYSDAELEAAKQAAEQARQDYLQAAAEAEQAKADYIAKAEQLQGVAQETTSQTILEKVEHITIPDDVARKQDLNPLAKSAELEGLATETQATANKNEILTKIEGIGQYLPQDIATQSMLNALKAAIQGTDNTATLTAIKEAIDNIQIDLSPVIANQQKMMVNFGMSEGEPQLQALTDTEIINTYDGYEDEGEHIEGIADQTYGHLVPAQVTIDDEPFTFYQERTYSDYGYSVLYRNGVAIDTTTTHPQEDDELTTTI